MSGVDVLDAITRAEGQARMLAGLAGDPHANRLLKDLAEARAAFAELIEPLKAAEQKLVELENLVGGGDDEIYVEGAILKARSALSRVRGAA